MKKKIVFMLPKVSYEGVAKVGLMQANLLRTSHQYDAEVISLIKEGQKFEELLSNLRVRYTAHTEILSRTLYSISFQLMRVKSDLIVAHNIPATILANRIFKKSHIPYFAYVHDASFRKVPGSLPSFGCRKTKEALGGSVEVFTNSRKTLRELEKEYNVKGLPLYPGCFPTEQITNRRNDFFLFVHFISPRRSFGFLANLLEKGDFNLVIAGGRRWGWKRVFDAYQRFGGRVRFVFEPSESDLSRLYQHAKGLVFPEIENFGLPPLEAAACGCPSVVARGSGVLEIFKAEKEIIACEQGDTGKFNEAIYTLRNDDNYAKRLAENAWTKAKEYRWSTHVSKLAAAVEAL